MLFSTFQCFCFVWLFGVLSCYFKTKTKKSKNLILNYRKMFINSSTRHGDFLICWNGATIKKQHVLWCIVKGSGNIKHIIFMLLKASTKTSFSSSCSCCDLQLCLCVLSGCSPSERLISRVGGQARSKTPNADMERSVYGADCTSTPTYLNKVTSA